MANMFTLFENKQDQEGRVVLVLRPNFLLHGVIGVAFVVTFVVLQFVLFGAGPMGVPWYMIAAPLAFGALTAVMTVWMTRRLAMTLTIDEVRSLLLINSAGSQTEWPLREFQGAEFVVSSDYEGSATGFRLIRRNGERVSPVNANFMFNRARDREKVVAALKQAFAQNT